MSFGLLIIYMLNSQHVPCLSFVSCQLALSSRRIRHGSGHGCITPKRQYGQDSTRFGSLQTSRVKFNARNALPHPHVILRHAKHALLPAPPQPSTKLVLYLVYLSKMYINVLSLISLYTKPSNS